MRYLKIWIVLISIFVFDIVYSQTILKIYKKYALIDIDQTSGLVIGDKVSVLRRLDSGEVENIGEISVVKFAKGKCAGKIVFEKSNYAVSVGDFLEMPDNLNESFSVDEGNQYLSSDPANVGIDKGDSEIRFLGFYMKMVGTDYSSIETGAIQLSYGYFITSQLQIGIAPQLMIYQGFNNATYTIFSASAFFNYNLATSSKIIPYISGQWYQDEFAPEYGDFLDYSFINIGLGIRNFFTEYAALNTSASYGFSLGNDSEGGLVTIMSGISFIF